MGYPNSWMVYFMENSMNMDVFGVPPFSETTKYGYNSISGVLSLTYNWYFGRQLWELYYGIY